VKQFSTFELDKNIRKVWKVTKLSAKCSQISVLNLTGILTVSASWYVHNFLSEISFLENVHNKLECGLTYALFDLGVLGNAS
jgi:hypothetical protein